MLAKNEVQIEEVLIPLQFAKMQFMEKYSLKGKTGLRNANHSGPIYFLHHFENVYIMKTGIQEAPQARVTVLIFFARWVWTWTSN